MGQRGARIPCKAWLTRREADATLTNEQKSHVAFWCKDRAQADVCFKALKSARGYMYYGWDDIGSYFVVHFVEGLGYDLETSWQALQRAVVGLPFEGYAVPDGIHLPHYEFIYNGPGDVCQETRKHIAKREEEGRVLAETKLKEAQNSITEAG
jgi:hypothetical protein